MSRICESLRYLYSGKVPQKRGSAALSDPNDDLLRACETGDTVTLRRLLDTRHETRAYPRFENSRALGAAVENGRAAIVRMLLADREIGSVVPGDNNGRWFLLAVHRGNSQICSYFLDWYEEEEDDDGIPVRVYMDLSNIDTALAIATLNGNARLLKLLFRDMSAIVNIPSLAVALKFGRRNQIVEKFEQIDFLNEYTLNRALWPTRYLEFIERIIVPIVAEHGERARGVNLDRDDLQRVEASLRREIAARERARYTNKMPLTEYGTESTLKFFDAIARAAYEYAIGRDYIVRVVVEAAIVQMLPEDYRESMNI